MNGRVQRQKHTRPGAHARRRQALLVRAVVGSLVLCAALAPHTLGQSAKTHNAASEVREFRPIKAAPFFEVLEKTQRLIEAGKLSPEDAFDFIIEADRNADGTFRNIKITKAQAANGGWQPLVREFITVLGQSGALSALTDADHLTMTLKLDGRARAGLSAVVKSNAQAAQLAQTYNTLLDLGRFSQRGRAGVEVLNNMAFSANGKQLTMQLEMSREMVGNLLRQQLSLP